MGDLFKIHGGKSNKPLEVLELNHIPGKNKAYGFLRKVNKKLDKKDIISHVTLQNAIKIKDSVNQVRDECANQSKLYKFQARFNPFSKAYKIEKLTANILNKINHIIKAKENDFETNVTLNTDNPNEFFAVSDEVIRRIKKANASSDQGYILYSEYYNKIISYFNDIYDHRGEVLAIPIQINHEDHVIRIMTEEEHQKLSFYQKKYINYEAVQRNAQTIMTKLQTRDFR